MRAHHFSPSVVLSAAVLALAGHGCGGTTAETKAAAAPTNVSPPPPAPTTTSNAPSSESAVSIAPDILKLCGISADEAFFPFDSTHVVPASVKPLKEVAICFTNGPLKGKGMKIVGHADPRGDTDYNFALGQKRADSVASFLHSAGLGQGQISTTSRGAMDATGSDEPTWAKDRRVDIMLGP